MDWPKDEIDSYSQVESHFLNQLYSRANIPSTDPKGRYDYLMSSNVIELSPSDKVDFNKALEENGESAAMKKLEEIAVGIFSSEAEGAMKTL